MVYGNTLTTTGLRWEQVTKPAEVIGHDTVYSATAGEVCLRLTGKWVPGCSADERVFWLHTNDDTAEPVWLGGPCLPFDAVHRATRAVADQAGRSRG